jgi:hypothetical protein
MDLEVHHDTYTSVKNTGQRYFTHRTQNGATFCLTMWKGVRSRWNLVLRICLLNLYCLRLTRVNFKYSWNAVHCHCTLCLILRLVQAFSCYSRNTFRDSPPFCMTTFSASLTNLTALLLKSHDCSCYLSRLILRLKLARPPVRLRKRSDLRALPTCVMSLDLLPYLPLNLETLGIILTIMYFRIITTQLRLGSIPNGQVSSLMFVSLTVLIWKLRWTCIVFYNIVLYYRSTLHFFVVFCR